MEYGIFGKIGPEVRFADFNGDMLINFLDYCFLADEWLLEGDILNTDIVNDNQINAKDLDAFGGQWLSAKYQCGQADISGNDDKVNFLDYADVVNNWLQQGAYKGDITGNGTVDISDLQVVMFYWLCDCEQ